MPAQCTATVSSPCVTVSTASVNAQEEARAHMEQRLSALPEGAPVVCLSRKHGDASRWLLTRCTSGQTPQITEIQVGPPGLHISVDTLLALLHLTCKALKCHL